MYRSRRPMSRHIGRRRGGFQFEPAVVIPAGVLYLELLLRIFNTETPFFSAALVRILFFSVAAGLLLYLILDLLPWRKWSRGLAIGVMAFGTVVTCVEYCCKSFFKTYFSVSYMQEMAGQVMGDFFGLLVEVVVARIPFILLSFIPLLAVIFLRKQIFRDRGQSIALRVVIVAMVVVFQLIGSLMSNFGASRNFYTYDFSANLAIPEFGVISSMRLELQYAIFGTPEMPLPSIDIEPDDPEGPSWSDNPVISPSVEPTPGPSEEPGVDPSPSVDPTESPEPTPSPIVYGYNVLDIDFAGLAESEKNDTLKGIHEYMDSLTPSQQNEYTNYFAGKNLILITAEAFSPYVISEELTPTLYKLANNGFVFNNYYQPDWTLSTTGGEFSVMTGLIPTWIKSSGSFKASIGKDMPIGLGWMFRDLGYSTLAYHNNNKSYNYYSRPDTHPNLGYDYHGIDHGLDLTKGIWPSSDLEMMQLTVDDYIQDYVENGTNFHAYYMTISGHCNYNWGGNAMARKYREVAEAAYPNYSETVQAYIACNLELEAAMAYLVEQLEAAGIADETVIVLAADHYPYAMAEGDVDYYNELTGLNDSEKDTSRYRNTLIMWCGEMEEPVIVDTPCSSIDIVPTICNLFGLDYDSRLYSGRDIFATNYVANEYSTCMPLVIFANTGFGNSWITAAGTYEASTKTFTPNPGIEVADNYVSKVNRLVQAKYSYAKLIIQNDYYSTLSVFDE